MSICFKMKLWNDPLWRNAQADKTRNHYPLLSFFHSFDNISRALSTPSATVVPLYLLHRDTLTIYLSLLWLSQTDTLDLQLFQNWQLNVSGIQGSNLGVLVLWVICEVQFMQRIKQAVFTRSSGSEMNFAASLLQRRMTKYLSWKTAWALSSLALPSKWGGGFLLPA